MLVYIYTGSLQLYSVLVYLVILQVFTLWNYHEWLRHFFTSAKTFSPALYGQSFTCPLTIVHFQLSILFTRPNLSNISVLKLFDEMLSYDFCLTKIYSHSDLAHFYQKQSKANNMYEDTSAQWILLKEVSERGRRGGGCIWAHTVRTSRFLRYKLICIHILTLNFNWLGSSPLSNIVVFVWKPFRFNRIEWLLSRRQL